MASDPQNFAQRSIARFMRFLGITSSPEISDSRRAMEETVHFGMFSENELRHIDGILQTKETKARNQLSEDNITKYLSDVASNTRQKMDEIKNLKILAPEIEQAKSIIVSSILSPQDLQTDSITVKVNNPGLDETVNAQITEMLTNYFNTQYHLAPKIAEWLGCAGFDEGAKPVMVLPKHQLDVLNTVADHWNPEQLKQFNALKDSISHSTEGLANFTDGSQELKDMVAAVESFAIASLESKKIGKDYIEKTEFDKKGKEKGKKEDILFASELAKTMTEASFKLIRTAERGDAIVVTKDLSVLTKNQKKVEAKMDELAAEAAKQIYGFNPDAKDTSRPSNPVLALTDEIKVGDGDAPVVIEYPADSVIPVCAPRDNKNHIGYYVLVDENGQPCRGQYAWNNGITGDINQRLATNAAKSAFGTQAVATYNNAGVTDAQMLQQMTEVFSVAINHLLTAKLKKEGLTGLDINVHEAVGKSIFFNLLAKNKIKMVFVPSPMMVYYRFAHREDGTGKTFLEDIAFILCLRCTFTIAKIMAIVENATKRTRVEVNVDEKNQNPLQTCEIVRHAWMNKRVPTFPSDPMTATEGIINQHLSIVPKGLVGNTDELNITTEQGYGQAQAPDDSFSETLNNWVCQGLKLPPSALNQLSETEYAKSVATSNLFFANNVRGWQNIIGPYNKKFAANYILASDELQKKIRDIIKADADGAKTKTKTDIEKAAEKDDASEHKSQDPQNDEKIETALRRVIATVEVVLPPPKMAVDKSHFEELNSHIDSFDKILEKIYPDDIAPNDELKSLMATIRAIAAGKELREFLPKLGFHSIAALPSLDELDIEEAKHAVQRLDEIKRHIDLLAKLHMGQLKKAGEEASAEMGAVPEEGTPSEENPGDTGDELGGEPSEGGGFGI